MVGRSRSGQTWVNAPGPDGLRLTDLSDESRWQLTRILSKQLKGGTYRAEPGRRVKIPKANKNGECTITVFNVKDRIVDQAAKMLIDPALDYSFTDTTFARFSRGRQNALDRLQTHLRSTSSRWVVVNDIRDAFDHVPIGPLLVACQQRLPSDLVDLLRLLIGHSGKRGIAQGKAMSPLLLNVLLDHYLNRPFDSQSIGSPLWRYVDDLLAVVPDGRTGTEVVGLWTNLLAPLGLRLKFRPHQCSFDLTKQEVTWLGYRLRWMGDRLRVRIAPEAFDKLAVKLVDAQDHPSATSKADVVIAGWLMSQGAAFPDEEREIILDKIAHVAGLCGFDDIQRHGELLGLWEHAWKTLNWTGQIGFSC